MSVALPRALLVTAEPEGLVSGNNTTIERFERRLRARGLEVLLARLPSLGTGAGLLDVARRFAPEVVHALHARHAGPAAAAVSRGLGAPLVVTSGGTDIDQDAYDPARLAIVRDVLSHARVLLVTHPAAERTATGLGLPLSVLRIPKGAEPPPPRPPPDPARFGVEDDEILFVLPAGVRPVKNNRFPIGPLARLHAEGLPVRLLYAGPVRDGTYAAELRADLEKHPFATWPGTFVGHEREVLYASADVLLNVSHSEGGANAILEAMARGCAILGGSIPGNEVFLRADGRRPEAGLLYRAEPTDDPRIRRHDPDDFRHLARELALSPVRRATLSVAARERARVFHAPDDEVDGILTGYRAAMLAGGPD